jgi:hypothetical protein
MGHVELQDGCVVFVFPEEPDESGDPKRMPWHEAVEVDIVQERTARSDRRHSSRTSARPA